MYEFHRLLLSFRINGRLLISLDIASLLTPLSRCGVASNFLIDMFWTPGSSSTTSTPVVHEHGNFRINVLRKYVPSSSFLFLLLNLSFCGVYSQQVKMSKLQPQVGSHPAS